MKFKFHLKIIPDILYLLVFSKCCCHVRGLSVQVFRGVPYAAPPLRFSPPAPPPPWRGVRTAGGLMPGCPQRLPDISAEVEALRTMSRGRLEHLRRVLPLLKNQSEDCLYLNIFTPLHGECHTHTQPWLVEQN